MKDAPRPGLTDDEVRWIEALLTRDLPAWVKDGLRATLEHDERTVELDIGLLLKLIDPPKPAPEPKRRGRPAKKRSIDIERAEAFWDELFDGYEKAGPETTRGVIERLRNEAKGYPEDHDFRMEVERLFPQTTELQGLEQSTSRGMAELKKRGQATGAMPLRQILGLNWLRDRPRYRSRSD